MTNAHGLVRTSDFFDNVRTSEDTRDYKVVQPGMYVYNPSRINVGSVAWLNEPSPIIVSPMYVVFELDQTKLIPEYLQLFFDSRGGKRQIESKTEVGARFRLTYKALARIELPLPSIAIQRTIVEILRTFTDLQRELEAELEARRQQFEHYRDRLLSARAEGVPWVPLHELGYFVRGKRFNKRDYDPDGLSCIHYGEIYTHYGTSTASAISRVRADLAPALRFAEPGDVVIVDVGETVEDVGKAVAWLGSDPVAIHDHSYAFRHDMNPTFVSYLMQTAGFRAERAKFVARTKVKTLLIEGFSRIRIPVPSRAEQDRIVAILDKFDALVNDLSIGLPAELVARRKQYEYYRDKLLAFPEAA